MTLKFPLKNKLPTKNSKRLLKTNKPLLKITSYQEALLHLKLDPTVKFTKEELKSAYLLQSKIWHPDLNPGKDTDFEFSRNQEAYQYAIDNLNFDFAGNKKSWSGWDGTQTASGTGIIIRKDFKRTQFQKIDKNTMTNFTRTGSYNYGYSRENKYRHGGRESQLYRDTLPLGSKERYIPKDMQGSDLVKSRNFTFNKTVNELEKEQNVDRIPFERTQKEKHLRYKRNIFNINYNFNDHSKKTFQDSYGNINVKFNSETSNRREQKLKEGTLRTHFEGLSQETVETYYKIDNIADKQGKYRHLDFDDWQSDEDDKR